MKVKVGDEVKVVGKYGGCMGGLCRNCFSSSKGSKIVIIKVNTEKGVSDSFGNRTIEINRVRGGKIITTCVVDERDLMVVKAKKITNWRQRLK